MAIALPMPLEAPVTNTDFPANSIYHFKFMTIMVRARWKAAPRLQVQSARKRAIEFAHFISTISIQLAPFPTGKRVGSLSLPLA
jgi:hypothetical protein